MQTIFSDKKRLTYRMIFKNVWVPMGSQSILELRIIKNFLIWFLLLTLDMNLVTL